VTDVNQDKWEPLTPDRVAELLERCAARWWIAGGYAIDAFVGEIGRRPHEDIDVGLLARDQHAVRGCLRDWELYCADPPGTLRRWGPHEWLDEPIHDVWCRPGPRDPWRLALVLNPSDGDTWVYRRDARIRRPVAEIVWRSGGIDYLGPDVQLLFKSKTLRPKDEQDFADALPFLDPAQLAWLREALELTNSGHPWLSRL
jgi:hypothetical protein